MSGELSKEVARIAAIKLYLGAGVVALGADHFCRRIKDSLTSCRLVRRVVRISRQPMKSSPERAGLA